MVIEAGVVVGYVIAWVMRKARRVGGGLDAEADAAIDVGLERLHSTVAERLGTHPALEELAAEAAADGGQVGALTRQQVELALVAAARKDEAFARTVRALVAELRAAEKAGDTSIVTGPASRVFGDAHVEAGGQAIVFGQVGGDARVERGPAGGQQPDPPEPGRSHP